MPTAPPRRYAAVALAGLLLGLGGCEESEPADVFHEFELLQLREEFVEASLGKFEVPVPVAGAADRARSNRMQFKFELFAVVKPKVKSQTLRLAERRQGHLRDRVISVCRNSSLDDLLDPQLSTFRSRVLDAIQPLLEGVMLERVLVVERTTEPL